MYGSARRDARRLKNAARPAMKVLATLKIEWIDPGSKAGRPGLVDRGKHLSRKRVYQALTDNTHLCG
jgi:hypothetical protein